MKHALKFDVIALVCLLLMPMTGCERVERDFGVKIVVPTNYTGVIRIAFHEKGNPVTKKDGKQVFRIGPNGTLEVAGVNPFLKLGIIEVEDTSGTEIKNAAQILARDREVKPSDRLFRLVGGTNDGSEFWAVIGTENDERSARLSLHDLESGARPR